MKRSRDNIVTVVNRLNDLGYRFVDPARAHVAPRSDLAEQLERFERHGLHVPLTLRTFYGDEKRTPPVPDEEGEAKGQLLKFFAAMNKWWKVCVKVTHQANALPYGSPGRDKLWREEEVALDQVFSEYCVNPRKARAERMAPAMVYYPIDKLVFRSVEKVVQDQLLFNIDKQGDLDSVTRYQFHLRKKKGQWLVDHKRVWRGGWVREPF